MPWQMLFLWRLKSLISCGALFAEGAFSQAFVPVLAEYREAGSQAAVKAFNK